MTRSLWPTPTYIALATRRLMFTHWLELVTVLILSSAGTCSGQVYTVWGEGGLMWLLRRRGVDAHALWLRVRAAVAAAVLACAANARVGTARGGRTGFKLLGARVVVDGDMRPWVVKLDTSPQLSLLTARRGVLAPVRPLDAPARAALPGPSALRVAMLRRLLLLVRAGGGAGAAPPAAGARRCVREALEAAAATARASGAAGAPEVSEAAMDALVRLDGELGRPRGPLNRPADSEAPGDNGGGGEEAGGVADGDGWGEPVLGGAEGRGRAAGTREERRLEALQEWWVRFGRARCEAGA